MRGSLLCTLTAGDGLTGDVIIGDTLVLRYEFMHRLKPHKLHSSKDWIGIFLLPLKDTKGKPDKAKKSTAASKGDEPAATAGGSTSYGPSFLPYLLLLLCRRQGTLPSL
jgi:hypothetical protein